MAFAISVATLSVGAHAQTQGPMPKCAVAEMIVNGAIKEYEAKRQGVPFDQQVKGVQLMAGKLAGAYGSNVGKTYSDVQTKILQSLYEGPEYASLSPQQFKDAMAEAFYHSSSCPQPI